MKPLPKSLHTVTVLVRMAEAYRETVDWGSLSAREAVEQVLADLGKDDIPDDHGLIEAALKQMED